LGGGQRKSMPPEVLYSSALARVFCVILQLKEIIAYKKEAQHNKTHA
jgi:hypothetical protein